MGLWEKKGWVKQGAGAKEKHDQIGKLIHCVRHEHTVILYCTRQNPTGLRCKVEPLLLYTQLVD